MSRERRIHPEIWTSDDAMALSYIGERTLFIGMFSTADDHGRGKASPASLKAAIFPSDPVTAEQVREWRDTIADRGMATIYTGDEGKDVYDLPSWHRWQRPKWRKASYYAPPPDVPRGCQCEEPGCDGPAGDKADPSIQQRDNQPDQPALPDTPAPRSQKQRAGDERGAETRALNEWFDYTLWPAWPSSEKRKEARDYVTKTLRPSAEQRTRIMRAIDYNEERNERWHRDRPQYVPALVSWLRKERWTDEFARPKRPLGQDDEGGAGRPPREVFDNRPLTLEEMRASGATDEELEIARKEGRR